jgi:hypothetical protein
VNLSLAERGINANGYATLCFDFESVRRQVSYGSQPDHLYSPASRAMAFNRAFFDRVAREIERAAAIPAQPAGDGSEYDAEEVAEERYRRLGVQRGSQFLNVGVDNQVTWPPKETLVKFDKYHLVLMPKTRDHAASVNIDLATNALTHREGMTVINRFLSIMTWCDDQFAIAQDGWSGNPIPVPVPKRDLAFTTAYQWIFDRKIPMSGEAQRALALFREARNAQQNYMVSYAVLNFFRIIEIRHPARNEVKNWFRDKLNELRGSRFTKKLSPNFCQPASTKDRMNIFIGTAGLQLHMLERMRILTRMTLESWRDCTKRPKFCMYLLGTSYPRSLAFRTLPIPGIDELRNARAALRRVKPLNCPH